MVMLYERIFAIYDFIAEYNREYGQMPTLKEIEAGVRLNHNSVSRYLDKMELMGMLERPEGKVRAITLIRRQANWNALIDR
jgi:SOS-response transcriptional repressor LexA